MTNGEGRIVSIVCGAPSNIFAKIIDSQSRSCSLLACQEICQILHVWHHQRQSTCVYVSQDLMSVASRLGRRHRKSIIFVQTRFHHFVLVSRLFYKTYIFEALDGLHHDIVAHVHGATSLTRLWRLLLRLKRWRGSLGRRSRVTHASIVPVR